MNTHSKFAEAARETRGYLRLALKALHFWRRPPPVDGVAELAEFAETRAKYLAQSALFGYVRTRAGTWAAPDFLIRARAPATATGRLPECR